MARRTLSPEEEAEIVRLYGEKQNSSQIAKTLGLAYQTVHRRVQKLGGAESQNTDNEPASTALTSTRNRKRKNDGAPVVYENSSSLPNGLVHTSTRYVYEGKLARFVHDAAAHTISVEIKNNEPLLLSEELFHKVAEDMNLLYGYLLQKPAPAEPERQQIE